MSHKTEINFGIDGQTATAEPYTKWQNIKLKPSKLWTAAFVEINNISYGPILKPTQEHNIEMKINTDIYKSQIVINDIPVFENKYYILGKLVISTHDKINNINDIVDFIDCSFYDH